MTTLKTIRQWLQEIPIPEIREAAIDSNDSHRTRTAQYISDSLDVALMYGVSWPLTEFGEYYWGSLHNHFMDGGSWQDAPMPPGVVNPLRNETKP